MKNQVTRILAQNRKATVIEALPGTQRKPIITAPVRQAVLSVFSSGIIGAAGVAQLVEQRIRNAKVGGSTPLTGTINHSKYSVLCLVV